MNFIVIVGLLLVFTVTANAIKKPVPIMDLPGFWNNRDQKLHEFYNRQNIGRISNGQIAIPHQFPYQIYLLSNYDFMVGVCGGSLISSSFVLTAAHCVQGANDAVVILGIHNTSIVESSQQRISVILQNIIIHPEYNSSVLSNDIALLRLTQPASIVPGIVDIVQLPEDLSEQFINVLARVSGWGRMGDNRGLSDVLRFTDLMTITNLSCQLRYGESLILPSNICTSTYDRRSTCPGDSGGPLTIQQNGRSTIIGIVSFGSVAGCEAGWPIAFARITSFVNWIRETSE